MFDVEVDAGLLWVDADLDGIVYCPVEGERELCGEWECTNYRLTGTRMLSKRTAEGLIVVRSMSELGRTAEQSPMQVQCRVILTLRMPYYERAGILRLPPSLMAPAAVIC